MITLEFRESANKWEEYNTYDNDEDLRQDLNQFIYNFGKLIEEVYIYYWNDKEEKDSRTKIIKIKGKEI